MLEVLIGTGVRVGKLIGLCVGDIEIGERSSKPTILQIKLDGYREIPLKLNVRKALCTYLVTHTKAGDPDAPLWTGNTGSIGHCSSVMDILKKYALLAGLEKIKPRALRHTFGRPFGRLVNAL